MTRRTTIARSSTGTYHLGLGPTCTACSRRINNRPATEAEIERSAPGMWCEKCFPNGKPACEEAA
jgi:hypothetical protein